MRMPLLVQFYIWGVWGLGNVRATLDQGHVAPALFYLAADLTVFPRALHCHFGIFNLLIKIKLLKPAMCP